MTRLARACLMAFLLLGGMAIGVGTNNHDAKATLYSYSVWNYPGPTYSPTTLNCGWHDDCHSGTDGNALDWRNVGSTAVYWRALSANEQNRSSAGTALVINGSSSGCNRTYVQLTSPLGSDLGEIRYSHTVPVGTGTYHNVPSGLTPVSSSVQIGSTAESDCASDYLPHLHQGREPSSSWSKRTDSTWVYPTRATCSTAGCHTYTSPWQYWQHQRTWWASY